MFKIKFNKNWWGAGAFCALVMNINTALGITEAEFNEKHDRLIKKLIPMRENFELPDCVVEFVAQRAGFSTAKGDEAYSICYLLCLIYSPIVILWLINEKNVSSTTVISALSGHYEDLDFDMHEILDSYSEEEWELDLSSDLAKNFDSYSKEEWELDPSSVPEILRYFAELYFAELYFNDVNFNDVNFNMKFFAELVRGNTSLTVLSLADKNIVDHEIEKIFEASKSNPNSSLKKIDLSWNSIGDYGALVIAEFLKTNPPLEELVLIGCGIEDKGIIALSEALKVNTSLNFLDMRENQISDTGKGKLADAMEINTTIIDMKY